MYCSAVWCSAVRCGVVQGVMLYYSKLYTYDLYISVWCSAVRCGVLQWVMLYYSKLNTHKVLYIGVMYAMRCDALQWDVIHCNTSYLVVLMFCSAVWYRAVRRDKLQWVAPPCNFFTFHTPINESCHTWMSRVIYKWVISHMHRQIAICRCDLLQCVVHPWVLYIGVMERGGAGVEYHFQEFNEPYAPS